jgi:hypothetical protein
VWNIERGFDRGFCLNYSIALRAQRPPRDASRPSVEGERFQIEPWCVAFKLPFCTHIAASGDSAGRANLDSGEVKELLYTEAT